MKLDKTGVEPATCSGVTDVTDFSINVTAQAFAILSSGLYKNPIKAIVRELSTNAIDSHIEAGTADKKFDVELPTKFSPLFRIRDYGTGLSKADVLGLYSSYFASTKTETNDQIGALGLGSKSPLGYTNSFSVVSYFNGTKYNFSVFIGDNGFPNIASTGKSDTDEPSGLEIIIPVKEDSYDMRKWYNSAKQVYRYFDVIPNIMGADVKVEAPEYAYELGNVKLGAPKDSYQDKYFNVIQGCIAYPIAFDELDITREIRDIVSQTDFDIYVKIGDVSFLPNREELSYDDKTKKVINDALNTYIDNLAEQMEVNISGIKSLENALNVFHSVTDTHSKLTAQRSELGDKLVEKINKRWSHLLNIEKIASYYSGTHVMYYRLGNVADVLEKRFEKVVYCHKGKRIKQYGQRQSGIGTGIKFWINDTKKAVITKFAKAVDDYGNPRHDFLIPVTKDVKKTVAYIKQKFGVTNEHIGYVSSLKFPEPVKKRKIDTLSIFTLSSTANNYWNKKWSWDYGHEFDHLHSGQKVYVEMKGNSPSDFISQKTYWNTQALSELLGENSDMWNVNTVYGVKTKNIDLVKDDPEWIHINEYIKNNIEQEIERNKNVSSTYLIDDLYNIVEFAKSTTAQANIQHIELQAIIDILKGVSRNNNEDINERINYWNRHLNIKDISEIGVAFEQEVVYNDGKDLVEFIKVNYNHLFILTETYDYNNENQVISIINDLYKEI